MASHAIESALPAGMTRLAVRERLGEPSHWPIFGDAEWFGAEDEAWWLGAKSAFARADEWLYLDFDGAHRLVPAPIIEDSVSRSHQRALTAHAPHRYPAAPRAPERREFALGRVDRIDGRRYRQS